MNNIVIIADIKNLTILLFIVLIILFIKKRKKWIKKIKSIRSKKPPNLTNTSSENKFDTSNIDGALLKNKIALVTGAGKGIGRAIAKRFAAEGARVLINSRTREDLESLKSEIALLNGDSHIFVGDVTNPETVHAMFVELTSHYGPPDICVNNAGTARFGFVQNFPVEDFQKIMNLNVNSIYNCTQEAVKLMEGNGNKGKIIIIGSIASRWSERGGSGAYTASKYAVYGMVESIARQLHGSGSNIAVGILCPGAVNTPLSNPNADTTRDNWLRPETVAASVLHMAIAPPDANIFDLTVFHMQDTPW
jgi:NAD(P)-dependent dehydrogenase (short-subunit alcohol dehydrogenase family)